MNTKALIVIIAAIAGASLNPNIKSIIAKEFPDVELELAETEAAYAFFTSPKPSVVENDEGENNTGCTCKGTGVERHDGISPTPCRCKANGTCNCGRQMFAANLDTEKQYFTYFTTNELGGPINCAICVKQEKIFEDMKKYGWVFSRNPAENRHYLISSDRSLMQKYDVEAVPCFIRIVGNNVKNKDYGIKTAESVARFYNDYNSK